MIKTRHQFAGLMVALGLQLFFGAPAFAAFFQTWVSGTGVDNSNCFRSAPCGSFSAALSATAPGGVVSCADSSNDVGPVAISKSVTIDCTGNYGSVLANSGSGNGIEINGVGIDVTIRGLTVFAGSGSHDGIIFQNGKSLKVENVQIRGFPGSGIKFTPLTPSLLFVTDTVLSNNGSGSTGGGIVVNPQSGGTAQVVLNRVSVDKNVFGIAADGTGSTGGINMTISDSVTSGNSQDGIIAVTPGGGAPIGVLVTNTKSVNNAFGIRSIGPNVTVRAESSKMIGNSTGLSFSSGGALLTFGNNAVRTNGVDGAFSGPVALQ